MTNEELELLKLQVEAWKTTVTVQQHFNDIEMRLRTLAFTVVTATLAAAGFALRDGDEFDVAGKTVKVATALVVVGLFAWTLFYMLDQLWYHRLLMGAVTHGAAVEDLIAQHIEGFGLGHAISAASPLPLARWPWKKEGRLAHSRDKLKIFYLGVGGVLILAAVCVASVPSAGKNPKPGGDSPTTIPNRTSDTADSRTVPVRPPASTSSPASAATP